MAAEMTTGYDCIAENKETTESLWANKSKQI